MWLKVLMTQLCHKWFCVNVSVQSSVFTYNTGRNRKLTQIISNDTRFTSFNLYTTTTTTTTIIFYTNTLKNYVTNEINVILPTLTGKPLAHNKNKRDNYVTLNVAFQKPKNPGGAGLFNPTHPIVRPMLDIMEDN